MEEKFIYLGPTSHLTFVNMFRYVAKSITCLGEANPVET